MWVECSNCKAFNSVDLSHLDFWICGICGKVYCKACNDCARRANSDATTPGFFYSKCKLHREKGVK